MRPLSWPAVFRPGNAHFSPSRAPFFRFVAACGRRPGHGCRLVVAGAVAAACRQRATGPAAGAGHRAGHDAARRGARRRAGRPRRAPRFAVLVVPPVGPGPRDPRRQLRNPPRHQSACAAAKAGAWRRGSARRDPGGGLELAPGAPGLGARRAVAPRQRGPERPGPDGRAGPAARAARGALLPRHLHLRQGQQRSGGAAPRAARHGPSPGGGVVAARLRHAPEDRR